MCRLKTQNLISQSCICVNTTGPQQEVIRVWSRIKSTNAGWPTGSKSESKSGTHKVNVPYVKADLGYRTQRFWREDQSGNIHSSTGPVGKVIPCRGLVS
jgi:hypothetical protein